MTRNEKRIVSLFLSLVVCSAFFSVTVAAQSSDVTESYIELPGFEVEVDMAALEEAGEMAISVYDDGTVFYHDPEEGWIGFDLYLTSEEDGASTDSVVGARAVYTLYLRINRERAGDKFCIISWSLAMPGVTFLTGVISARSSSSIFAETYHREVVQQKSNGLLDRQFGSTNPFVVPTTATTAYLSVSDWVVHSLAGHAYSVPSGATYGIGVLY